MSVKIKGASNSKCGGARGSEKGPGVSTCDHTLSRRCCAKRVGLLGFRTCSAVRIIDGLIAREGFGSDSF